MGLSDGERVLMICSAVLIQSTCVMDRQMDEQTVRETETTKFIKIRLIQKKLKINYVSIFR